MVIYLKGGKNRKTQYGYNFGLKKKYLQGN